MSRQAVSVREVFGLKPLRPALRQSWGAVVGDGYAPPSLWGPSSIRMLIPRVSFPLWLGRARRDKKTVIINLPNRVAGPDGDGYSVRVTYARDFRGGRLTYDSHDGTDFAIPPGTEVVAAAPGVVTGVRNDMQRGGLKVVLDHGGGIMTVSCHLSRALVGVGQRVARGEIIALSGMSGVDGVLFCPWLAPHVHYTVMLNGVSTDPWAREDEESLWVKRNDPVPHDGTEQLRLPPTEWDAAAVDETIASCRDVEMRRALEAIEDTDLRAATTALERRLSSHRFAQKLPLTRQRYPRRPVLDLPFAAEDFTGSVFAS